MPTTFKITVNDNLSFELTNDDIARIDAVPSRVNSYHILKNKTPFNVEVIACDFNQKKYGIKVNNNTYSVAIADALDQLVDDMGFALASDKKISSVAAPMPGLILEINVEKGQEVEEDDPLLILEAMKMENVITSPRSGTIKSIGVSQGEAVDKKQILIEFE